MVKLVNIRVVRRNWLVFTNYINTYASFFGLSVNLIMDTGQFLRLVIKGISMRFWYN